MAQAVGIKKEALRNTKVTMEGSDSGVQTALQQPLAHRKCSVRAAPAAALTAHTAAATNAADAATDAISKQWHGGTTLKFTD